MSAGTEAAGFPSLNSRGLSQVSFAENQEPQLRTPACKNAWDSISEMFNFTSNPPEFSFPIALTFIVSGDDRTLYVTYVTTSKNSLTSECLLHNFQLSQFTRKESLLRIFCFSGKAGSMFTFWDTINQGHN